MFLTIFIKKLQKIKKQNKIGKLCFAQKTKIKGEKMVKASCIIDYAVRKMIGKNTMLRCLILIFVGLAGLGGFVYFYIKNQSFWSDLFLLFAVPLVLGLLEFISHKQELKHKSKLVEVNTYYFDEDAFTAITKIFGKEISSVTFEYNQVKYATENQAYIFIHINKNTVYPVYKDALSRENICLIKNWLDI